MNQQDIAGSNEILIGGLPVANALMALFDAQNTTGANNLALTGFVKAGYLGDGVLDTSMDDFLTNQQEQGLPGADLRDGNVALLCEGEGHRLLLNAAMLMHGYMDPVARQQLIDARIAQGLVAE